MVSPPALSILSLNVAGLKSRERRKQLFHWLLNHTSADVFLLQETHLYPANEEFSWSKEWAGFAAASLPILERSAWWSPSDTSHSGGTAILIRPARRHLFKTQQVSTSPQHRGAHTTIICDYNSAQYSLHSIYAPSTAAHRLAFFNDLPASSPPDPPNSIGVYGGDYNCVNVPGRDTRNMPHYAAPGAAELNDFCLQRELADAWLAQSQEQLQNADGGFTHHIPATTSASRIDRIYLSASALDDLASIEVVPHPDVTDHDGVLMSLVAAPPTPKSSRWRLNTRLLEDQTFLQVLKCAWEIHLSDYPPDEEFARCWLNYKHTVKRIAVSWATARAADKRKVIRDLQNRLKEVDIQPAERDRLRQSLSAVNDISQSDQQLTSSASYQSKGDRPTFQFFSKVKSVRASSSIPALTMPDGAVSTSQTDIEDELCRFWGGVLGEGMVPNPTPEVVEAREKSLSRIKRRLDEQAKANLENPITLEELAAAMKNAQQRKTPGSDGLPVEFYKATWDFTGPVLVELAQNLQLGVPLPREIVHANIALAHKTDSAAPASSKFRPLALLNADYKLLASTLASRLSPLLTQLIDELQTGFVPGRLIMENITFNRDLLDYAADEQLPVYMAFLDFEKAFDRVSWEYRDAVMAKMNFPPSFITAIKGLYSNSTNSLLVNSSITRAIQQTRGVRQGCPLSPFLFAIFAEPLGLLLRSLEGPGVNRPKCGVSIPTLRDQNGETRYVVASQFADDTTIYASSSQALRFTMSAIQSEFCTASGAKLNPSKTRTLCGGSAPPPSPPRLGLEPWQEMDIMLLQGNDTLKSLGAVYSSNIPPESRFGAIIEKIQQRMMRWQSRHPSLMARVLIANTLLSSCIWFFAYFLVPTAQQLNTLDAVIWGMIWGKERGALGTRGLVNRHRMALPAEMGGLKVIIPSVMIKAILDWRVYNRYTL